MILNKQDLSISLFVGEGTYFGLIFVFLKSKPTIEVPRGTITPPYTLFSLYNSLSEESKSKFEVKSNAGKLSDVAPFLNLKLLVHQE